LDGLIKHNGPVYDLSKYNKILGKKFFKNKINFRKNSHLEAQISAISDDIAYNSHDLEDGLKANLFDIEDLMQIPILSDVIKNHKKKTKKNNKELVLRQIVREIINEMVKDIIENTKKNIKHNKLKSLKNVLSTSSTIVCFSPNMNLFDLSIKEFLREKMYYSKDVLKKTNQGKKIIKFLFLQIMKNPKKFINLHNQNKENIERCVCDFIAGMTDRYAINLYKKIK
jgi:dGTPase